MNRPLKKISGAKCGIREKKYGSVNRAVCLYKFHVMKN
jgi:hypothetical protein